MDEDEKNEMEKPVSDFPAVVKELSVLVPADASMTDIEDIVNNEGGEFLIDVDLKDFYDAPDLAEGAKKEMIFKLFFQAKDRVLTEKDIKKPMEKIKKALKFYPGFEVK